MQFIDKDTVDVPVMMQRQVLVIQKVQKTVEVPQGQHMDRIVDVTFVLQHQVPTSQTVQKTVEVATVPAEVVDVLPGSLVSACLVTARTVGAKSSSAAEAAFEAPTPLNRKFTAYAFCCEFQ